MVHRVSRLYAVHFETALVRVTLDDGRVGWGEAQAPLAPEVACTIVERLLRPVLLDADFDGILETIQTSWDRMYATMRVRGQTGGFMLDAISGVDLALWDLAGKIQDQPVSALIPGSLNRTHVRAYHSGVPGESVAQRIEYASARRAEGFGDFKLFYDSGREEFLHLLSELRGALGPAHGLGGRCTLALDAGGCGRFRFGAGPAKRDVAGSAARAGGPAGP